MDASLSSDRKTSYDHNVTNTSVYTFNAKTVITENSHLKIHIEFLARERAQQLSVLAAPAGVLPPMLDSLQLPAFRFQGI